MIRRKAPLRPARTLEARLWAALKVLDGTRFRRKCPFKSFILDFVEHDHRLVVTLLDGAPGKPQPVHIARDRLLGEQGYVILRLWRAEAERDLHSALHTIKTVLADLDAADSRY